MTDDLVREIRPTPAHAALPFLSKFVKARRTHGHAQSREIRCYGARDYIPGKLNDETFGSAWAAQYREDRRKRRKAAKRAKARQRRRA